MIRLQPTPATAEKIEHLLKRVDALRQPAPADYAPIQDAIRLGFAMNFDAEQGNDQPWAPLAKRTEDQRQALGYPRAHPILVRSGDYKRSFTDADDPDHISEEEAGAGLWRLSEGSADYRAGTLEFGNERTPPRPVTILGRSGENRLETVLGELFSQWFEDRA